MTQLDRTGLILSGACLVHCAVLPLSVLVLPSLGGVLFDHSSLLHWILLGLAIPVSGYALIRGFREHGERGGLLVGTLGLLLMGIGVSHLLAENLEIPLTLSGAAIVAGAHLMNIRLLSKRSH